MNSGSELALTLRAFGPLRITLILAVILAIILRPEPGVRLSFEGIEIARNLIIPVLTPIFFMLLLLDTMMSLVYRSDKPVEEKARYLKIVFTDVLLAFLLISYWMPFYIGLTETL